MSGKLWTQGVGNMTCNDAAHGRGDADGTKFSGVFGILEDSEQVGVGEVGGHNLGDGVAVDQVK